MKRVAVIASASGNGKTTVGRALAQRLGVPFVELDALHWGPNWTEASAEELRARVEPIVTTEAWVIDGVYRGKLGDLVLENADVVVWLDLPARVWFRRLLRRTVRRILRREEFLNGNRESLRTALLSRDSLLLYAARSHLRRRRLYPAALARYDVTACARRPRSTASSAASGARPELRDPGRGPQPQPDRGEQHVEDDVRGEEQEPPEDEARQGQPALLAQVAPAAGWWPPQLRKRRLAGRPIGPRLGRTFAHALAAARRRRSTRRMIRMAVSSTDSSETSMTGHRSRRCNALASSSSA